jgi:hypothetical protein
MPSKLLKLKREYEDSTEEKPYTKEDHRDLQDRQLVLLSKMRKIKDKLIDLIPDDLPEKEMDKIFKLLSDYKITTKEEVKRAVKRALSGKDIEKTSKKSIQGGAITKPKKTIEIDEKGVIIPRGFTEKEKDIIRKIDHNIYTPETIIQIIKDIASKKVKSPKDFPKADYGESEEEEEEEIPEEKPKKGTHGGFRVNAGRKIINDLTEDELKTQKKGDDLFIKQETKKFMTGGTLLSAQRERIEATKKRIQELKELKEKLKESKSEPKTKPTTKTKKTIEIDEKGTIRPIGFTEKEKDIIRKIDHNIYSPETIIQIIKDIASKKVKSPKDFPKADYGESEEEEEEIPEEKPKKGTHGGFRVNAGRKKTEKPVEVIKEEIEAKKNKMATDDIREDIIKLFDEFPEES